MAETLAGLGLGQTARVSGVAREYAGRERLLALGFIPGQPVTAVQRSVFGDPTAYRVAGALIALRRADAVQVEMTDQ